MSRKALIVFMALAFGQAFAQNKAEPNETDSAKEASQAVQKRTVKKLKPLTDEDFGKAGQKLKDRVKKDEKQ